MDDAKNIFKKFKATGNFVQDPRSGNFYEIIDTQGEYQGIYINNRRNERLITPKFKIHYSKKGLVHVVPEHPNKK